MTLKPFVAGNWKMYTDSASATELADKLKKSLSNTSRSDIAVFPPFTSLSAVISGLQGTGIAVGGQNLHWEKEGAFTGEVSANMLKHIGCEMVLIGHSERRTYFGEKDSTVLLKTIAALDAELLPVVCVGETLEQRESGITEAVVERQITDGLGEIKDLSNITLAYEPVWAIGTGRNATPQQAQDVHNYIRILVAKRWNQQTADSIRILYGGSVKPDNSKSLWGMEDIDGFLVGGASLKADSFAAIVESVK
jgi:triosephosphate isomerase (TIM)